MRTDLRLIRALKGKQFSEASECFADIMRQKVADRLHRESTTVLHETKAPTTRTKSTK